MPKYLVVAGAALLWGNTFQSFFNVLTTAGPGDLAAFRA